jgi:hypothetical protein
MALCTSNVTSGFIDLATFDEIEKYLYGGDKATAYFVRETRKSTWFTQVPVCLSRAAGQPAFGQEFSFQISRAGDYLLQTWLRLTTPAVQLLNTNAFAGNGRIRWTQNFMHNIVRECSLTFNDLTAARFDHYHLDFWAAFTVPAGKRNAYDNMIGNFASMVQPHGAGVELGPVIAQHTLNLPLPFFYTRDSGVALPTAALPYNDMRINFSFRNWNELLILDNIAVPTARNQPVLGNDVAGLGSSSAPIEISNCQLWANYAIVSNDERKRMGCAPRDILIEQVQTAPRQTFTPSQNGQRFDIRFSHAVKVLFFAVRNSTFQAEWSNYTTASPIDNGTVVNFSPFGAAAADGVRPGAVDPILQTSLIYENTNRLAQMGSDYFSLVNPYYTAVSIPDSTGYHLYSYSLDFYCLDPMGSTNYGKLTNVSIVPEPSSGALTGAQGNGGLNSGMTVNQTYEFVVTAVNNNIVRIAGGALGFPVL